MILEKLKYIPTNPGCYLMKDQNDQVIYVGKAKNLKNRVKSYFTGAHNEKTTRLVQEIADFSYVIANNERESLILEMNLIKQYKPKYNIRLTDDKTYPYIEITNEEHPRLLVVRTKKPHGKLFGPYPNVYAARETADLLNRLYPFRKCDTIPNTACLYYHIGQCLGPCINSNLNYDFVAEVEKFLKGDTKVVLDKLNQEMVDAASNLLYEKASEYRDMIKAIKETTEKQIINLNDHKDRDVVGFAYNKEDIALQILIIRKGQMIDQHQIVFSYINDFKEALFSYLSQFYEHKMPDEILFPKTLDEKELITIFGKNILIPKIGDKKKLVDMAETNATHDLEHYYMLYRHRDEKMHKALNELSNLLNIKVNNIEIFDNSQLFGTAPISAMVSFKDYKFNKKMYRKYHLSSKANDDYEALREVIYRRYFRLLKENSPLPDLILVDGGKGHITQANDILNSLNINVKVCGLKKNKKHNLESLVYEDEEIMLLKQSELYKFLASLSEEVHRFAIDFHRKTRSKSLVSSPLDEIKGIGPKRKKLILSKYKDLEQLKNASVEELKALGLPDEVIKNMKEVFL